MRLRVICIAWMLGVGSMAWCAGPTTMPRGYTIPVIDLSQQQSRQVVVDREKGHPDGYGGISHIERRPVPGFYVPLNKIDHFREAYPVNRIAQCAAAHPTSW